MSGELLSHIIHTGLYILCIISCKLLNVFTSSISKSKDNVIEPPYGLQPFLGVQREPDNGFFNDDNYIASNLD